MIGTGERGGDGRSYCNPVGQLRGSCSMGFYLDYIETLSLVGSILEGQDDSWVREKTEMDERYARVMERCSCMKEVY